MPWVSPFFDPLFFGSVAFAFPGVGRTPHPQRRSKKTSYNSKECYLQKIHFKDISHIFFNLVFSPYINLFVPRLIFSRRSSNIFLAVLNSVIFGRSLWLFSMIIMAHLPRPWSFSDHVKNQILKLWRGFLFLNCLFYKSMPLMVACAICGFLPFNFFLPPPPKRDKNRPFYCPTQEKCVCHFFNYEFWDYIFTNSKFSAHHKMSIKEQLSECLKRFEEAKKKTLSSSCMEVQVSIPEWFRMQCKLFGSSLKARVRAPRQPLLRQSLLSPPRHPPRWYGERGGPCSCPGFMGLGGCQMFRTVFVYKSSLMTELALMEIRPPPLYSPSLLQPMSRWYNTPTRYTTYSP